jgi:serine/threonine protein kinase
LIDFGLSRTYDRAALATDYTRTPYTISPETATSFSSRKDGRVGGEDITDKTDVWALGVVTFVVLSGEFPFIKTSADLKDKNLIDKLKRVSVLVPD